MSWHGSARAKKESSHTRKAVTVRRDVGKAAEAGVLVRLEAPDGCLRLGSDDDTVLGRSGQLRECRGSRHQGDRGEGVVEEGGGGSDVVLRLNVDLLSVSPLALTSDDVLALKNVERLKRDHRALGCLDAGSCVKDGRLVTIPVLDRVVVAPSVTSDEFSVGRLNAVLNRVVHGEEEVLADHGLLASHSNGKVERQELEEVTSSSIGHHGAVLDNDTSSLVKSERLVALLKEVRSSSLDVDVHVCQDGHDGVEGTGRKELFPACKNNTVEASTRGPELLERGNELLDDRLCVGFVGGSDNVNIALAVRVALHGLDRGECGKVETGKAESTGGSSKRTLHAGGLGIKDEHVVGGSNRLDHLVGDIAGIKVTKEKAESVVAVEVGALGLVGLGEALADTGTELSINDLVDRECLGFALAPAITHKSRGAEPKNVGETRSNASEGNTEKDDLRSVAVELIPRERLDLVEVALFRGGNVDRHGFGRNAPARRPLGEKGCGIEEGKKARLDAKSERCRVECQQESAEDGTGAGVSQGYL